MTGLPCTSFHCDENIFYLGALIGTEICIDDASDDHHFAGGTCGTDEICKGSIEIQIQLSAIYFQVIDGHIVRKDIVKLQFFQHAFWRDFGYIQYFGFQTIGTV